MNVQVTGQEIGLLFIQPWFCLCTFSYLKAEVLPQDATMKGLHCDGLPAPQIQALHGTARVQQGLMRTRFFELRQPPGPVGKSIQDGIFGQQDWRAGVMEADQQGMETGSGKDEHGLDLCACVYINSFFLFLFQ